jgi:hypothetical protein
MPGASVDAPLSGGGWRADVLDERASGHALRPRASEEGSGPQAPASASAASNRNGGSRGVFPRRRTTTPAVSQRDPRERSEQSDTARAAEKLGCAVQRTRRTTARILLTRLHGGSTVASVALRLTGFTQLPQPATSDRQPRFRGTVVGKTGWWRICAHSVDICVEARKVAVPEVPAGQGKGTDNSGSFRVSGSRSDARRLRSQQ